MLLFQAVVATFFQLYINQLPEDVICNIIIYADNTTFYFKSNEAFDLRQQLELDSNRKWLVDCNARKS